MSSENPSGADNQQETSLPRVPLDPMWIVGFVDGEGCFSVSVHRNASMRGHRGWQIQPSFQTYQHRKYRSVLDALRSYFGCGYVRSKGPYSDVLTYSVWALEDLERKVLPFFEEHFLVIKQTDFVAFATIVRAMRRGEHLEAEGFERIARIAYGMNANGKQRSRTLVEVLEGSSETRRQACQPILAEQ